MYTSYFAKIKQLPEKYICISICGKAPDWYNGLQYKKLAPKWEFFQEWKKTGDNNYYIKEYEEQVLSELTAKKVIRELKEIAQTDNIDNIILLCYEKPGDFCHRHLVAEWLSKNGYRCEEYGFNKLF